MKTVLITGSKGQLGSEIHKLSSNYKYFNFIFTDVLELDITNESQVFDFYEKNKFDFIVNCAAYTAVDKAETDFEFAKKINIIGVKNLAKLSSEKKIPIIHVSTDYVFDGHAFIPYKETDKTNPNSAYGNTKLLGEKELQNIENHIIIRTSWLYSSFGNNFVKTMFRLGNQRESLNVVFDQVGTPTYAEDLAKVILHIIQLSANDINSFKSGIYHYSNEGVCSWYDFAVEIMKVTKTDCKIFPIETKDYPTPAKRPNYSLLNKSKIKNTFQISIPHWADSLKKCILEISKNA